MDEKDKCPDIFELLENPDVATSWTAKQSGGRALGETLYNDMMDTVFKSKGNPNKSFVTRVSKKRS